MQEGKNTDVQNVRNVVSDPTAIGLFGLAMVTFVASTQKLGLTNGTAFVIPWAVFLGAMAQLYASVLDAKLGNTFGATAFGGYGFFWLGVAMSWLIKMGVFGSELKNALDDNQLGDAFCGYLIFTLYMTFASLKTNKVLTIIFVLIDFLFLGLMFSTWGIAEPFFHKLAAFAEFAIAIFAFYGSAAAVINNQYGRVILPIGKSFVK